MNKPGSNGHATDSSAALVDAAVKAIEHEDPEQGVWADLAANLLTAGEGVEVITQLGLQDELWYRVPRRMPPDEWAFIVEGAARLFDRLGLERYALIARSLTTRRILAAWAEGDDEGFAAYNAAADASGVQPPDTDLLRWGGIMGDLESAAFDIVAGALEAALAADELRPGTAGWRAKAAAITEHVLNDVPRLHSSAEQAPTWLDLVKRGRIELWIRGAGADTLQEYREASAAHFLDGNVSVEPEVPAPDALEIAIGPLRWLLEACRDGVKATARGYLPPVLVREAAERFDWWIFDGQPRTEADVIPLTVLHEIATRNRWLVRRKGTIRTTQPGLALLKEPAAMWRAVTATLGRDSAFDGVISELIAHRLLEGPASTFSIDDNDELTQAIAPVVLAQGWRTGMTPVDPRHISRTIYRPLGEWRVFGLLTKEEDYSRPATEGPLRFEASLTPIGRVAALAHLYARATEPRDDILG